MSLEVLKNCRLKMIHLPLCPSLCVCVCIRRHCCTFHAVDLYGAITVDIGDRDIFSLMITHRQPYFHRQPPLSPLLLSSAICHFCLFHDALLLFLQFPPLLLSPPLLFYLCGTISTGTNSRLLPSRSDRGERKRRDERPIRSPLDRRQRQWRQWSVR